MRTVPSYLVRFLKQTLVAAVLSSMVIVPAAFAAIEMRGVKVVAALTRDEMFVKFSEPSGVFFDEVKKRLYVADSGNSRLVSFDSDFKYVSEFSNNRMNLPIAIGKLSDGNFIVTDGAMGELMHIDLKQKAVEILSVKKQPPAAEKFFAGRFAIDSKDRIYVIDKLNKRILTVSLTGEYISSFSVKDPNFYGFTDVKVDGAGSVYALDTLGSTVYIFDTNGSVASKFTVQRASDAKRVVGGSFPSSVAPGPGGRIYVLDRHLGDIAVYSRSGTLQYILGRRGFDYGEHYSPSYMAIDESGRIFTTDGNRVQVLTEEKGVQQIK